MKRVVVSCLALTAVAFVLPACAGAEGEGEGEGEGEVEPACTEPTDVECRDQSFQNLAMSDTMNMRAITDDGGEVHVDATAGGFGGGEGWVYGKFTDDGFKSVHVADDASFDSMGWDLGFRRFVIRLNSGVGGPSCVTAVNLGAGTAFDDVTDAPDVSELEAESYFIPDDNCRLVPDGSGLETSPGTLLQNYWQYSNQNCLQMTENVYAIQLADGRFVKLEVFGYYQSPSGDPLAAQVACNEEGAASQPSESGHIRFRWSFL
jgi:HmuY protein